MLLQTSAGENVQSDTAKITSNVREMAVGFAVLLVRCSNHTFNVGMSLNVYKSVVVPVFSDDLWCRC